MGAGKVSMGAGTVSMGTGTGTIPQTWILETSHKISLIHTKCNPDVLESIVQSLSPCEKTILTLTKKERLKMRNITIIAIFLLVAVGFTVNIHANDINLVPDGTYVGGEPELAPDGTYVGTDD